MWVEITVIAVLALLGFWFLKPWVDRHRERLYQEEDFYLHEEAYVFAVTAVVAAEQYGVYLIKDAIDEDRSVEGVPGLVQYGDDTLVKSRAKFEYAVEVLQARFPELSATVADALIEEAVFSLTDEGVLNAHLNEEDPDPLTIEGSDWAVINTATGEVVASSKPDQFPDARPEPEVDCDTCTPDTCKASCQGSSVAWNTPVEDPDTGQRLMGEAELMGPHLAMGVPPCGSADSVCQHIEHGEEQGEASIPLEALSRDSNTDFADDRFSAIDVYHEVDGAEANLAFADDPFAEEAGVEEAPELDLPEEFFTIDDNNLDLDLEEADTELIDFSEPGEDTQPIDYFDGDEDEDFTFASDELIPISDQPEEEIHDVTDDDLVSDTEALILSLPSIEDDVETDDSLTDLLDLGLDEEVVDDIVPPPPPRKRRLGFRRRN